MTVLGNLGAATTARARAFWTCWRRFNCDFGRQ